MLPGASIFVTQQILALVLGYTIVESLVVRQRLRDIKDMYRARHVGVHQANQLEVPCHREDNCEFVAVEEKRARGACGSIETCGVARESGATHGKRRSRLAVSQERDRVRLVGRHRPGDRLACVNPYLVWQKSKALPSEVGTLRSDGGIP